MGTRRAQHAKVCAQSIPLAYRLPKLCFQSHQLVLILPGLAGVGPFIELGGHLQTSTTLDGDLTLVRSKLVFLFLNLALQLGVNGR